jgi:RNAse (barnase) inhibitor barstar
MRYELDGECFDTLAGFARHFSDRVLVNHAWDGNLDAFNDILRGGFGTPDEGFTLVWRNSELSRQRLGYSETVRFLEGRALHCLPANRAAIAADLERARMRQGRTVFDWLVEIISDHGVTGSQARDNVVLELC